MKKFLLIIFLVFIFSLSLLGCANTKQTVKIDPLDLGTLKILLSNTDKCVPVNDFKTYEIPVTKEADEKISNLAMQRGLAPVVLNFTIYQNIKDGTYGFGFITDTGKYATWQFDGPDKEFYFLSDGTGLRINEVQFKAAWTEWSNLFLKDADPSKGKCYISPPSKADKI